MKEIQEAEKLEREGNPRQASAKYAQAAQKVRREGDVARAKSLLECAIRLSPKSPRLYIQMALCEISQGNEAAAKKSMQQFSRYALAKPERLPDYRAYLEAQLADYPVLRQVFYDEVVQLDRTDAKPFLAQARAHMEQGKTDKAIHALIAALRTKTHDAEALELLREALKWKKDREALDHLALFEAGRLSRKDFLTLIFPQPQAPVESKPKREARAEEPTLGDLIAHLEEELGLDIDESRDTVAPLIQEFRRRSQKVLGRDAKARIDMATAYFEMGLHDEALAELAEVRPEETRYPEALCLTGEVLFKTGSLMGALDAYQRCLRVAAAPVEAKLEARYRLVQIYSRLGDWEQALVNARELEKKRPDYRDVRMLRMAAEEALGPRAALAGRRKTG